MVVSEPGMYSRPLLAHHFELRFLSGQVLVRQNMIEKKGKEGQKTNIFSQTGDAKGETMYPRLTYITNFTQKTVTAWHKQPKHKCAAKATHSHMGHAVSMLGLKNMHLLDSHPPVPAQSSQIIPYSSTGTPHKEGFSQVTALSSPWALLLPNHETNLFLSLRSGIKMNADLFCT